MGCGGSKNNKITFEKSFFLERKIGAGGFGRVYAVTFKPTKKLYAIKQLKKDVIIQKENVAMVFNERDLLIDLKSKFIANVHYCLQGILHSFHLIL
jgi:serine/threonine protein kinase